MFQDHKALKKLWICSNPNLQHSSLQTFCDIELLRNFKLMSSLRIRKWVKLSDRKKVQSMYWQEKRNPLTSCQAIFSHDGLRSLLCQKNHMQQLWTTPFIRIYNWKVGNNFDKCSLNWIIVLNTNFISSTSQSC